MEYSVITHGSTWISENRGIRCPECSSLELKTCEGYHEQKDNTTKACMSMRCLKCNCYFVISRKIAND